MITYAVNDRSAPNCTIQLNAFNVNVLIFSLKEFLPITKINIYMYKFSSTSKERLRSVHMWQTSNFITYSVNDRLATNFFVFDDSDDFVGCFSTDHFAWLRALMLSRFMFYRL